MIIIVLFYFCLLFIVVVFLDDVVGAALDNTCSGNESQFGFLLKFRDLQSAAVAHGGTHLVQRKGYIILQ